MLHNNCTTSRYKSSFKKIYYFPTRLTAWSKKGVNDRSFTRSIKRKIWRVIDAINWHAWLHLSDSFGKWSRILRISENGWIEEGSKMSDSRSRNVFRSRWFGEEARKSDRNEPQTIVITLECIVKKSLDNIERDQQTMRCINKHKFSVCVAYIMPEYVQHTECGSV